MFDFSDYDIDCEISGYAEYNKEYNDLLSQKEYIESRLLSLSDKIDELEDQE